MTKDWLSYDDQVALMIRRGIHIEDPSAAASFLSRANYYRFSGYFRHWQRDPQHGDNRFICRTSFEKLQALYQAEESLINVLDDVLHPLEILLRTRFAHAYGMIVGSRGRLHTAKGSPSRHILMLNGSKHMRWLIWIAARKHLLHTIVTKSKMAIDTNLKPTTVYPSG